MPGAAKVVDARFLVHLTADAVACEVPHHAVAVCLGEGLHRVADVAQRMPGDGLPRAREEAGLRDLHQPPLVLADASDRDGQRAVRLPAVQHQAAVQADDRALPQHLLLGGDAVHHRVVHAGAQGGGKALIAQERGRRPVVPDVLFGHRVQLGCGHARLHSLRRRLQRLIEKRSGPAHAADLPWVLDGDHAWPRASMILPNIASMSPSPSTFFSRPLPS